MVKLRESRGGMETFGTLLHKLFKSRCSKPSCAVRERRYQFDSRSISISTDKYDRIFRKRYGNKSTTRKRHTERFRRINLAISRHGQFITFSRDRIRSTVTNNE